MSMSRKDVGADLEQGCSELILHLIKLAFFPNSSNVSKWRKEVANFLHRTFSFKGSHKLPSKKFILSNTYYIHEKYIDRYFEVILLDYGKPENEIDIDQIKVNIKLYFEWIAEELSKAPAIPYTSIYKKLEELDF